MADTWTNPPTVGIWGPPVDAAAKPPRARKSWGLGDVLWVVGALLVGQILLGLILLIWAAVASTPAGPSPVTADDLLGRAAALATTGPGLVLALLSQWAAFVGVPYLASRRKGHGSLARDFGLSFRWRDLPLGAGLAVAMQVVMVGGHLLLGAAGVDLSGSDNTGMVTNNAGIWLIVMALAAAVGAPLTEELLFRGLLLRALLRRLAKLDLREDSPAATVGAWRRRAGITVSVLLSSALFGIMHAPVTEGGAVSMTAIAALAIQTGLLGAVFAVVAIRMRRLGPGILAHMFFNASSLVLTLLLAG